MALNVPGLAVGKMEADKRGLPPSDSLRIGMISAMMPNLVMSLLIGRRLAERQATAPVAVVAGAGGQTSKCCLTAEELQTVADTAIQPVAAELVTLNQHLTDIHNTLRKS